MSLPVTIAFAIATVESCPDEETREAGLLVLRAEAARPIFDAARTATSQEFAAQLRVHMQSAAILGAAQLVVELNARNRAVSSLAFTSNRGNVGLFFELDAAPIGCWVIKAN